MSEELTAQEVLEIVGEICEKQYTCSKECQLFSLEGSGGNCIGRLGRKSKEVIEICKQWKREHTATKTEWVDICRIIKVEKGVKKCVHEVDITQDILPFSDWTVTKLTEDILKAYCMTNEGEFFANVAHICRPKKGK
ncbi:MAG: hypothetical protein NC548_56815 [Lachnospiraceae bacterium]|nr:hypothetical protein [Lachnospiraceae bacterium]